MRDNQSKKIPADPSPYKKLKNNRELSKKLNFQILDTKVIRNNSFNLRWIRSIMKNQKVSKRIQRIYMRFQRPYPKFLMILIRWIRLMLSITQKIIILNILIHKTQNNRN